MEKKYLLSCSVLFIDDGKAVVSVPQYDCSPVLGRVPVDLLEARMNGPWFNAIPVRVLKQSMDAAWIEWDTECVCGPETRVLCPGSRFRVRRSQVMLATESNPR
ncbi:MAG: hypothetical protein KGI60_01830 [Patescibacteria group bacterium]|nr:hypothetical protein [Patescibacteria group bacterium]